MTYGPFTGSSARGAGPGDSGGSPEPLLPRPYARNADSGSTAAPFGPDAQVAGGAAGPDIGSATDDGATTTDTIGIAAEVDRLARVLCAHATTLPLAVAILGDWGSGKSSFMQMVQARVHDLAGWQQKYAPVVGDLPAYAARVRQVRFNAWHYSDEYALVGMVDELFRELADQKVMKPPVPPAEVTRLRAARDTAARELRHAEEHREAVGHDGPRSLWSVLTSGRRGRAGLVWLLVTLTAILVAWQGEAMFAWLPDGVAEATRWVVAAVGIAAGVIKSVQGWRVALRTWQATVKEQAVAALEPNIGDLRARRDSTELAYLAVDATARLAGFLDQQRDGVQYDTYRGAVGLVYRNLEELAQKIADDAGQQTEREERDGPAVSIDRIVLYVDDLDRCAPERVVEVLHAVNLLQVLPLFVVVVSVDAQWLRRSLAFHDRAMFGDGPSVLGARVGDPLDYLDKIFQIPYSLPPMGREGAAGLVRALVGETSPGSADRAARNARSDDTAAERVPGAWDVDGESGLGGRDMRLAPGEEDLLAAVAAVVRTPRGVKKLVNLYRLVRVGPQALADPAFADPEVGAGRAVALLLAAVVGMPAAAPRLLTALSSSEGTLPEALAAAAARHRSEGEHEWPERCGPCADLEWLGTEIGALLRRKQVPEAAADYRPWLSEVARYSFHSARFRDLLADAS
ncbi:P-loop NTPase fold protein [Promicromonospora sp. NPDC023805]|uniref:P-loop NTPase fold protein n=1 Tax=Promicromonospora sp. NPDC023805 TaxID=3154696 RepID=UPI003404D7E5